MRPLPDALKAPIRSLDEAKAWVRALHAADLTFHFEDDATDCLGGVISQKDAKLVNKRVAELYALEWGPRPGLGKWYCPIGYSLSIDPFDPANQAEGCLPGVVEVARVGDLRLLDCVDAADYEYGAPGRYSVIDESENGGHVADYDTPEEAVAANPTLQAAWRVP